MNRGDVVIVDWPYSDLSGSKLRPAVVVQADFLNGLVDDTIYHNFANSYDLTSSPFPSTDRQGREWLA